MAELQRSVYVAMIVAESAWLASIAGADGESSVPSSSAEEARSLLREVHTLAKERNSRWVVEDSALWLYLLDEPVTGTAAFATPFREHCEGRWREAAAGWRALGRPYEEALALSGGDDTAQRQALGIFDRLGALPAAARLRRQMRVGGARAVPRGPIAGTRANPAGLTRRQVQVLHLVNEGLSNPEIAARLCISVKTAEHHVSAIMGRLDATTRQKAVVEARNRGLLSHAKK
jgi:DNA-binding CsgD family transcriptional regulator